MSPLLDDRGRLFGRVNILDILVLLLIVALGAFAFTRVHETSGTAFTLRTTLRADKLRYPPVEQIRVGQSVRDDSGNVQGKVESRDLMSHEMLHRSSPLEPREWERIVQRNGTMDV